MCNSASMYGHLYKYLSIATLSISALLTTEVGHTDVRSIKVAVSDQQGAPVSGALVIFDYTYTGSNSEELADVEELTDENGLVNASLLAKPIEGISVSKVGFYSSWVPAKSNYKDESFNVSLKPVLNPVPLYARTVNLELPQGSDIKAGFDFFHGDWVMPHGKGTTTDLEFSIVSEIPYSDILKLNDRKHIKVSFPNENDGLFSYPLVNKKQDSDFQFPYMAPEDGYSNDIYAPILGFGAVLQPGITPPPTYPFAFARIRSKTDENTGQLSANYLKLYPSIQLNSLMGSVRKVRFTYYLNKTPNDRNLEFLPTENLFSADSEDANLNNLNLMQKNRFHRTHNNNSKQAVYFHQSTHYRTEEEIINEAMTIQQELSSPYKAVFVTDTAWAGNLGGVAGANQKCQIEADRIASLTGKKFLAWLSDGVWLSPKISSYFHQSAIRYATVDGKTVAKSFEEIASKKEYPHIGMNAAGEDLSDVTVWTNTGVDGAIYSRTKHCQNWTSKAPENSGPYGVLSFSLRNTCRTFKIDCDSWTAPTRSNQNWSAKNEKNTEQGCQAKRRLYCFEQ